jgi:hypothetical protein
VWFEHPGHIWGLRFYLFGTRVWHCKNLLDHSRFPASRATRRRPMSMRFGWWRPLTRVLLDNDPWPWGLLEEDLWQWCPLEGGLWPQGLALPSSPQTSKRLRERCVTLPGPLHPDEGLALLQIGTVATCTHFTVATGLIWPVTTVAMRHSSDGRPRHHRPFKLVATGERWCQLHPSLLRTTTVARDYPSLLEVQASHHWTVARASLEWSSVIPYKPEC